MSTVFFFTRVSLSLDFALASSANDEELDALGLESLLEQFDGSADLDGASAVEQVHCCVAVLGPGVDRVVRLLDDDRTADAVGLEFLEAVGDDRGFGDSGCFDHCVADGVVLLQGLPIAAEEFDKEVTTQGRLFAWSVGESFGVTVEPFVECLNIIALNGGPAAFLPQTRGSSSNESGLWFGFSFEKSSEPTHKPKSTWVNGDGGAT